jgi:hypothetical protein
MSSLTDLLLTPDRKEAVYADCTHLVENFLAGRGGMKGFAMKTALATAKKARPDILERAARRLTPDFTTALDPLFQQWVSTGSKGSFADHLVRNEREAVAALLLAADRRVERADNRTLISMYGSLRKGAESDVAKLLPDLGRMLERHLPA